VSDWDIAKERELTVNANNCRLPLAVISVINDIKNDAQNTKSTVCKIMEVVAETRQVDHASVFEAFDFLQQRIAFRLADYYATGNMEAAKETTYQDVQFPDANVKPS
jgi:hypothetical protein